MIMRELSNNEFSRFTSNFDSSIYQTKEYAFVMNKQKFDSIFIGMIDENNNILAAACVLIENTTKFKYAYVPRGYLIDYRNLNLLTEFTKLIKSYLNKRDVMALKICPPVTRYIHDVSNKTMIKNNYYDQIFENLTKLNYFHMGYNNYFEALKPRFEAILNLDDTPINLFRKLSKKLRTKIRGSEKCGITIHEGTSNELDVLYDLTKIKYPRNLKYFKDSYEAWNRENKIDFYYAKLNTDTYLKMAKKEFEKADSICEKLNNKLLKNSNSTLINQKINYDKVLQSKKEKLIQATNFLRDHPNGIITAGVLVVKNNKEVFILIDGHDKNYSKFNSKHLLIWKIIEKYASEGFSYLNFGGVTNPNVSDNKFTGLNRFKTNFGANIHEYIGDFEFIVNQPKYFMHKNTEPFKMVLKK